MVDKHPRFFAPIDFRTRFPALDGLRAMAILAVFAEHYGGGSHGGAVLGFLNWIHYYGWLGVDLFFVLSGFLITGILYDTLGDSQYFKRFFARRSLRIFPVYYLTFAVLLLLTPVALYQWRAGHLLFLVYLGNFIGNYNFSYYEVRPLRHTMMVASLSHFWSLCVEEQFYLLWPFAVFLLRKRNSILTGAAVLSLLALVFRLVFFHVAGPEVGDRWIVRTLPFRMDSLLIGGMLALLLRGSYADTLQRNCKWILFGFGIPAIYILTEMPLIWHDTLGFTFTAIAAAALIGCTLRTGSPAFRLFHLKPLRTLGKYSYGFYIYHLIFRWEWIKLLIFATKHLHSTALGGIVALTTNFIVTFLAAKFSYDLFESRFLRFKKNFEYDSEIKTHRHAFVTK